MKKFLIISDVHGAFDPLDKVLNIFEKEKLDKIICLGDILYHGPRNDLPSSYAPKKVIERLKPYMDKFIWVQGNCDAEVDMMVLNAKYLKNRYLTYKQHHFIFTHGHHLSSKEPNLNLKNNDVVVYGHYHVFDISTINGTTYINVGSTSIPKDGIPQYAILDENGLHVYDLNTSKMIGEFKI